MAAPPRPPGPASGDLVELGVRQSLPEYLRAIWAKRDFAWTVPLGELRAANQNTVLGSVWHLLNPLLLAAVFYLVFGVILDGRGQIDNFVGYLTIGILVFTFTQKSLLAGSRTIVANLPLIQSITFPRIVLPSSSVVGEAIAHVPALLTMLVVVLVTGELPHWTWVLIVPAFALQILFNIGLALISGRLTFHFRDTQNLLPFFTRLWMYLSAIFYSVDDRFEGTMRQVFELNPLYQFITINRDVLLADTVSGGRWLYAGGWALSMVVVGFFFFRAKESDYGRGY